MAIAHNHIVTAGDDNNNEEFGLASKVVSTTSFCCSSKLNFWFLHLWLKKFSLQVQFCSNDSNLDNKRTHPTFISLLMYSVCMFCCSVEWKQCCVSCRMRMDRCGI